MERRNTLIERDDGQSMATFSLVAVIVVVALIGLFVWQPWNTTSRSTSTTTTVTAPAAGGAAQGGSTSTSDGGSK